jgi:hypothetical protein
VPKLQEAFAAHWWRMTLPQFRAMEMKDQAEAVAVYLVKQQVDGYYHSESQRAAKAREAKEKQKNRR